MDFRALGNTSVVGLQWGDEGKGKIVDLLTEHFDVVVRYAGGANAGHTVRIGDQRFALHLIPSGILRRDVLCVIGPGVVLDPQSLCGEIDALRGRGVEVGSNLLISNRAHLVMPYHRLQDQLSEKRLGAGKLGTTARGIGPCYADKMIRATAFRVADLQKPTEFRARLAEVVSDRRKSFLALYSDVPAMDAGQIADEYLAFAERLAPHVGDTTLALHSALASGKRLLFEGAQGSLLDIDHGTFPFVTSSTCTAAGAAAGAGVPPSCIRSYFGVMKAYSTRVGAGPFPTELADQTGDLIRERGHEYGTTTGRPRRIGWFDAFATRYAVQLAGITHLAVMHLDTLGTLPEVRICTGYSHRGRSLTAFPPDVDVLEAVEPTYETLPGWNEPMPTDGRIASLPTSARRYLDRLESLLGVEIHIASVGADRSSTLFQNVLTNR